MAPIGPVPLERFDHVSVPCRDLEEATCFYVDVLGGVLCVVTPIFCEVLIGGSRIGYGTVGTTFMQPGTEYPHMAPNDPRVARGRRQSLTAPGVIPSNVEGQPPSSIISAALRRRSA